MQPIAAVFLVKLPNGKVLSSVIMLWGASLAIMSACTDFRSLLGMRFVLGAFESFIAPTCLAVTQMWWRRSEQTLRTSFWNAMNGVTSILGSLFTYGLGHIESDRLYKYQIVCCVLETICRGVCALILTTTFQIFLFCGLLTVAYSLPVFLFMPDSPMEAKFMSDREKMIATERLRANQMGIASKTWRWDHVKETFLDVKTYLWFIAITSIS